MTNYSNKNPVIMCRGTATGLRLLKLLIEGRDGNATEKANTEDGFNQFHNSEGSKNNS
jgi:hypothetical protein